MYCTRLWLFGFVVLITPALDAAVNQPAGQVDQLLVQFGLFNTRLEETNQLLTVLTSGTTVKRLGIGMLGFLCAYQGLCLLRKGIHKTIHNNPKHYDASRYLNTWWTPERQKGISLCTSGLACIAVGSYAILKPHHIARS